MSATKTLALVLVALGACHREPDRSAAPAEPIPGAAASASVTRPASVSVDEGKREPATTDGAIAVKNLDSQIRGARSLVRPGSIGESAKLADMLVDRASFLGRIADYEEALSIAEALAKEAPADARALLARASARSSLHEFQKALSDVEAAAQQGANTSDVDALRAGIFEAIGKYDEALAIRKRMTEANPTISTLGSEAALLGEMGKVEEASRRFDEARKSYRNVSPFPLAWIGFQEGLMWERVGDLERAKASYRSAHARLPAFAHAATHLALLELPARGVELLEATAKTSDDPEVTAQLAKLYEITGAGKHDEMVADARRRFDDLVKKHPAAFADHAGWFWLGLGKDPKKALELAASNVEVRKTSAAYELLLEATAVAANGDAACRVAEEALRIQYPSDKLKDRAAQAFAACGKAERAAELRNARKGVSR